MAWQDWGAAAMNLVYPPSRYDYYSGLSGDASFQNILQGYTDREAKAMEMLYGMGEQQRRDIEKRWKGYASQGIQQMYDRGMASPYLLPSMGMGYQRQMGAELGSMYDQLRQTRLGAYTGLSGERLGYLQNYQFAKMQELQNREKQAMDAYRWATEVNLRASDSAASRRISTTTAGWR